VVLAEICQFACTGEQGGEDIDMDTRYACSDSSALAHGRTRVAAMAMTTGTRGGWCSDTVEVFARILRRVAQCEYD